jgi:hypothetical protein
MKHVARAIGLLLILGAAGCSTVNEPAVGERLGSAARLAEPGRTTVAEIAQRLGPPRAVIEFKGGHRVWHYYAPRDGLSLLSALPMTDLLTTERGRAAKEVVLLFDRDGILRQALVRDLPFPDAQSPGEDPPPQPQPPVPKQ